MTTHPTPPATRSTPHIVAPQEHSASEELVGHADRGRFNTALFSIVGGSIDRHRSHRRASVFADLPATVVELGAGVVTNLR